MSPTFNERENIDQFLTRVRSVLPQADVFIVDDDSPDGTGARVAEWATRDSSFHLLSRRGSKGYAEASREGLEVIAGQDYDAIVTIDCDLSHDPAEIPHMLQRIREGADVVIGSRYVRGGGVEDWSVFRRLLSRWGTAIPHSCLGSTYGTALLGFGHIKSTSFEAE